MEKQNGRKLESLDETLRAQILELANNCRLVDIVLQLKEQGVETSPASLSRFIREDRERRLLEEAEGSKEAVTKLAAQGRGAEWREGTLVAVRQRFYERALCSRDPAEARAMYAELVKEEARLRDSELEARKVAVAEEEVRLQRLKLEAQLAQISISANGKGGVKGRVKGEIVGSELVQVPNRGEVDGAAARQLEAGNGDDTTERRIECAEDGDATMDGNGAESLRTSSEREMKLERILIAVAEVINRGGGDERIVEARGILADAWKS